MNNFKKGDILVGKDRSFDGAYHPVIYIDGPEMAPLVVVLTHSSNFPCNIELLGNYGVKTSHFIAHLMEKVSDWGPYEKVDELETKDIDLIETYITDQAPITYEQYKRYASEGCLDHT